MIHRATLAAEDEEAVLDEWRTAVQATPGDEVLDAHLETGVDVTSVVTTLETGDMGPSAPPPGSLDPLAPRPLWTSSSC